MKRILYSICIGSLALAFTASGAENKTRTAGKGKAQGGRVVNVQKAGGSSMRSAGHMRTQRSVATPRVSQRSYHATPKVSSSAVIRHNNVQSNRVATVRERNVSSSSQVRATSAVRAGNNVAINRERNLNVNRRGTAAINNPAIVATNQTRSVNRNVTVNNNWRSSQFSGQNYAAFRNYSRTYHDRSWWHATTRGSRFIWVPRTIGTQDIGTRLGAIILTTPTSPHGPIYGYNSLSPDRVVVDVQVQLQRDGYYAGPIDGVLGPVTRRAITAFQADHGLAITSSIDEPR